MTMRTARTIKAGMPRVNRARSVSLNDSASSGETDSTSHHIFRRKQPKGHFARLIDIWLIAGFEMTQHQINR